MTNKEFDERVKEITGKAPSKFGKTCLVICCGITLTTLEVMNGVIETGKAVVEVIRG